MKISLQSSGLLDPRRLDSWIPERCRAIRKAIEAGMKTGGKELAEQARARMQDAFQVRRSSFLKSMRAKVYAGDPRRFPALRIGSKIRWLGIHERGGVIGGKNMLIPLLPAHQRLGRKAFHQIVDTLMRSGNAFFIQKNGRVILMAENLKENAQALRRFKRAERARSGSVKRGQEIPIAVLLPAVTLRRRFDLAAAVRSSLPRLTAHILRQFDAHGL